MVRLLPLVMTLSGCAGDPVEADVPEAEQVVPVETWSVVPGPWLRSLTYSGTLRGEQQAVVVAETGGRVVALPATLGSRVGSGGALARLEDGRQRIGVSAAEADLERAVVAEARAVRQAERADALGEAIAASEREDAADAVALASADRLAAEAQLSARRRDLGDTVIRAPFAGELTRLYVDVGQVIGQGTPVAAVADRSRVRVRVGVSPGDLEGVATGTVVRVEGQDGRVVAIDGQVDPVTGLVRVEVQAEAGADLVVGATARVEILLQDEASQLSVPRGAVLDRYGEAMLFVVEGGRAVARGVTTGPRTDTHVVIASGLEEGDEVVVRGVERLVDGRLVVTP